MNLTKEQIAVMELKEVDKNLKLMDKTYKLDQPISEWASSLVYAELDNIINTLAYLEDRKQWLVQYGHLQAERKE